MAVVAIGVGKVSEPYQALQASDEGLDFFFSQQFAQRITERLPCMHLRAQLSEVFQHLRRDGLAGEVPDHCAQLVVGIEGNAVVNRPYSAVLIAQAMATLTVGVIGDEVEERHALKLLATRSVVAEVEEVLVGVAFNEQLHGAKPMRAVAQHGGRHEMPSQRFADQVGSKFAQAKRAIREVPQSTSPRRGLYMASRLAGSGSLFELSVTWTRKV